MIFNQHGCFFVKKNEKYYPLQINARKLDDKKKINNPIIKSIKNYQANIEIFKEKVLDLGSISIICDVGYLFCSNNELISNSDGLVFVAYQDIVKNYRKLGESSKLALEMLPFGLHLKI